MPFICLPRKSDMKKAFFLTGTDTGVGKTFSSCALLHAWRAGGIRAVGYKPIASGAEYVDGVLCNEDALALHTASSTGFAISEINPVCMKSAIAPHLAARDEGIVLSLEAIQSVGWIANTLRPAMARQEDNSATLKSLIHAPCLGVVPDIADGDPAKAASFLVAP
jgi:dethiobiotin synthetase